MGQKRRSKKRKRLKKIRRKEKEIKEDQKKRKNDQKRKAERRGCGVHFHAYIFGKEFRKF
ncbi:hypothetical protein [Methanosarcina barkeri]|uniref:Uncharacterized protein n=1 Tax=Methanosarcina barkeri CM1 TaxID=796385 RepID=A0A0G3C6I9_METBA|nr:hypothetical protein [Methanosarcina barkeri]AKJ37606.1 hypothetical protein MCM1_0503 [Methanosarcina barkeri CM1]